MKRILLVEDRDEDAAMFLYNLKGLYDVVVAMSLKEACLYLQTNGCPDLIFTDLLLPDASGTEAPDALSKFCPGRVNVITNSRDPIQLEGVERHGFEVFDKGEMVRSDEFRTRLNQTYDRQILKLEVAVDHLNTNVQGMNNLFVQNAAIQEWRSSVVAEILSLNERLEKLESFAEERKQISIEDLTVRDLKSVFSFLRSRPIVSAVLASMGTIFALMVKYLIELVKN